MSARKRALSSLTFFGLLLSVTVAWAIGFEIGQSKEELELKYEISVVDHGTGRVTVNLVIADEGKLKPLDSVDLVISSEDGTTRPDLSVSLATRKEDGKLRVRAHMKKELAERAQLQLKTGTNPRTGKPALLAWFYYPISVAELIKKQK
ncbi:hypothetical protein [uncultured Gimesia sp.]|uniref:hypothetical protein n=1 Tax=uncultured Gimesia sp. TaxID=1678688 RepID=UPI0030D7129C|tara:strand:- start:24459 stop:24905 length:447 start_codon:yes stop_codon:yes gene_type:complete